jgi:glutathione peroxidase
MSALYNVSVKDKNKNDVLLSEYKDKVILIVNTASKCGFTPQYKGLQELYDTYSEKGLVILAFPCNQFGKQEPGSNEEIQEFCQINYGLTFPVMDKIDVNGEDADLLYGYLKEATMSGDIEWNFTKFLVDRTGLLIERFAPGDKPEDLVDKIEALLS